LSFSEGLGAINVQGTGSGTAQIEPGGFVSPVIGAGASPNGLRVRPSQSISLIGGSVTLDGGVLTAPAGHVNIASVANGQVEFSPRIKLDYTSATLGNILLNNAALLDASGVGRGEINLEGNQISLLNSSFALIQSNNATAPGAINVSATNSFLLRGNSVNPNPAFPSTKARTGIVSQALSGLGANINVTAKNISLEQAGGVLTYGFGSGIGGNLTLNASNSIQLVGINPVDPITSVNTIASVGKDAGTSGNILISAPNLLVQDGGLIAAGTYGLGTGGNISVKAVNIELIGNNPTSLLASSINTLASGQGNAGGIDINTQQLRLLNGGGVASSTQGQGSAGTVLINAFDLVEVSGQVPGSIPGVFLPSFIISSANKVDPLTQKIYDLPPIPSGSSGNLLINTGWLDVSNGAQVTVKNDGTGNAGNLQINADSIELSDQGGITASTASGEGGNIQLNLKNLLLLQNNSNIAASAGGTGTEGNITIKPDLVVVLEGSRISADAEQGLGGRVDITAKGLFYSSGSITARSALGPQFNGTVQLNTLDTDFAKATALAAPPPQAPEVASVCQGGPGSTPSQFVKAGSGGIVPKPGDLLHSSTGWQDQPQQSTAAAVQAAVLDDADDPDVQGVIFHPDGTLNFITQRGVFYSSSTKLPCKSSTVRK